VQLPGSVNVTAGPISVFPAFENLTSDQASFAAITTQTFNTSANRATVRLVTSAAWPCVLTLQAGSPLSGAEAATGASEPDPVAVTVVDASTLQGVQEAYDTISSS
jgi:hypothetical protein